MDAALLGIRILLALVFTVAGVGKLLDRPGSRRALADFGVPARLVSPAAILVSGAELAIAAMLTSSRLAHLGATAAFSLLLLFLAGVMNSLRHGRRHPCHCFGQFHSAPVSWWTAARTGVLAAIAAVAAIASWNGHGRSELDGRGDADFVVLAVAASLVIVTVIWIARRPPEWLRELVSAHPPLRRAVQFMRRYTSGAGALNDGRVPRGLPTGTPAPGFSLRGTDEKRVTLASLLAAGKPVVLIFSDPDCVPCVAMLPAVGRLQRAAERRLTIALISAGSVEANRGKGNLHGLDNVLIQESREVAEAYMARSTPSAVLVMSDGLIASALAIGEEAVRSLVTSATEQRSRS